MISLSLNNVSEMEKNRNNIPIPSRKNVPIENLVPTYGRRKYTKSEQLNALTKKTYNRNGRGIIIGDITSVIGISKVQKQRKAKHLLKQKKHVYNTILKEGGITHKKSQKRELTEIITKVTELFYIKSDLLN